MKQFGRKWRVILYSDYDSIVIDNLRVSFDVIRDVGSKPNKAKINIWNLSLSNIERALKQDFKNLTLSVGYGELNLIFKGDILKSSVLASGVDKILTLDCADGFKAYSEGRINLTLESGATDKEILNKLIQSLPNIKLGQFEVVNKRELPRGRVLNGDIRNILTQIANNNLADWSIQDNELNFIPRDKVLKNQAVYLSQETGMIKSPQRTDDGLEVDCLLNPNLKVGGLIQVNSIINSYSGFYKIVKLKHKGDGLSNDWSSHIIAVEGNYKAVSNEL